MGEWLVVTGFSTRGTLAFNRLKGNYLLDCENLLSANENEKNDKVILKYFKEIEYTVKKKH